MKTIKAIAYGNYPENVFDAYLPENSGFDTIIWFHGGGFQSGGRNEAYFAEDFADKGYALFAVDYRMYPNAKFPDFIEDGAAAVAFIKEHIAEYGGNGTVYVSGQSAGAYLTMMLCLNKEYLKNAGVNHQDISGFISDSAQQTVHFNVLGERGCDKRLERIDEGAPLFFVNEDTSFSKLLLIYYTSDLVCRKEQNMLMFRTLKRLAPSQKVEMIELEGQHCQGSSTRNKNGEFEFVNETLRFINN